jgi:hypothetical protein
MPEKNLDQEYVDKGIDFGQSSNWLNDLSKINPNAHFIIDTPKEHIIDKWIRELRANGYEYEDMVKVFRLAAEKIDNYKINNNDL